MYLQYHGLALQPFENTADPRFFFAGEDHREALANIVYALRNQKGMVLITGDIGAGKTTLCHAIEHRGRDVARLVLIRQAPATGKQLLKQICLDLGAPFRTGADRAELFHALEAELLNHHRAGRTVMLIIDEAQALRAPVFDEIRLISNIETPSAKLAPLVLMGQSELRAMIQSPQHEALRQRLVLAHHLKPLSRRETQQYIDHRLRIGAAEEGPRVRFSESAVDAIHRYSGGVPRLINTAADNCLLVAFVRSTHEVDQSIVREVTAKLVLDRSASEPDTTGSLDEMTKKAA